MAKRENLMGDCPITKLERNRLLEILYEVHAETDQATYEISQGVVDGVLEAIDILGGDIE